MSSRKKDRGREELRSARRASRGLFWAVGLFSLFANLLMLTGPIFMLQVYDRVLGSRSEETLIALALLVTFLYGIMGILDFARGRIMARVGARFQARLDRRVFSAVLRRSSVGMADGTSSSGLQDLESIQRLMASPVLLALFDLPWTPIFLIGIAVFHPWLGGLAVAGGLILIVVTLINQRFSQRPMTQAAGSGIYSNIMSEQLRSEAEMVHSLGMRESAFDRWGLARDASLKATMSASDITGTFSSITKTFRLFLQSAMLGLGAYLVLQDQITPGAMIAASILMGRALAPIEQSIGNWALVQRARMGWNNLADLLTEIPKDGDVTELPRPKAKLDVHQVTVVPPGEQQAALRMVSFALNPGQAVGVIGPSGAGKSTLARALTGVWRAQGGRIRLDGATLEQYAPDVLGRYIGYLPQRVQLFDGTIKENIARLDKNPDDAAVIEAAKKAGAHEMIKLLPEGYDTRVSATSGKLSGGQMQRIGLARALYGDPVLLILDEPNSNLDNEGSQALNEAIRAHKAAEGAVMIMAHRPAAIAECDLLLMLDSGVRRAFGPKEQVLREVTKNAQQIQGGKPAGGVT
ncbi:type I secretion system permease/ATPase [Nereida sp. MMG025]|uniref:type I secretion system permease/ATPase n=1 Tax=Nereida sp. MMG025 TaxID=2909981 RepID=UPI001F014ACB|nr:type I secretion system permease/ATPase [Nereida sp. MMG025]MCF6444422.1 type I secretion system permease/ATPase [Nereida sp. MMG025]